jgi:hypothetical protein
VEVIVTEKRLHKLRNHAARRGTSDGGHWTSPVQYERLRLLTIAIQDITSRYKKSSTTITITKFIGTNYAHGATEMALLLEQKQVNGIIKGYDDKPEEPVAHASAIEKAAFND